MRSSRAVALILTLFISASLWSQNAYHVKPGILVRLSFNSSLQDEVSSSVCIAVSGDGHYRMLRPARFGNTEMLEGTMSDKQLQRLNALLDNPEFQQLGDGSGGGIIRNKWKSFGAEVFRDNYRQRLQLLEAEGTGQFPASVHRIIDWLLDLEPVRSKPFSYTEYPDVCPSGGMRPAQPLASR